jgi:hypothetical protein
MDGGHTIHTDVVPSGKLGGNRPLYALLMWIFVVFLTVVGVLLSLAGNSHLVRRQLLLRNRGVAVIAVVVQMIRRRGSAALIYAGVLAAPLFGRFFESEGTFWRCCRGLRRDGGRSVVLDAVVPRDDPSTA